MDDFFMVRVGKTRIIFKIDFQHKNIFVLEKSIPQGSVVSPHLANLVLDIVDETLMGFGMKLVRYADDFLVLCKTEEEARDAIELTDMLLDDLHLDPNPIKTKIVSFDQGFKFLGAIFLYDGIYLPFLQAKKKDPGQSCQRRLLCAGIWS